MRFSLVLAFLVSSVAMANGTIRDPQFLFDYPDHLTQQESCIVNALVMQSPDNLNELIPSGNIGYPDAGGGPIVKNLVDMLALGKTKDGRRLAYNIQFSTGDGSDWLYFQAGELIGVYATSMNVNVDVLDYHSGQKRFSADVSHCQ
jgi:hypothetical protein